MLKLVWINKFHNNFDAEYANCWALTMLICGAIDEPKWARVEECEEWLKNSTHKFEGDARPGDIFVMRSPEHYGTKNCLEHTAIYLGDNTYWHKPGSGIGQYTTFEDMTNIYREAYITEFVRLNSARDTGTAKVIEEQVASLLKDAA